MPEISKFFDSLSSLSIVVVGDVMLDSYLYGKVERISPEAPVPIVAVNRKDHRLGGAANVALNLKQLSVNPILCSVIGNDEYGEKICQLLEKENIESDYVIKSNNRISTVKTRVIGNNQQVLRVDEEITSKLKEEDENALFDMIIKVCSTQKVDALIFEDYDKGCLTSNLITKIIGFCKSMKIPSIVDPKKRNFLQYKEVDLFKPNLKELKEGLKIDIEKIDKLSIDRACTDLHKQLKCKSLLITLSENGVYWAANNNSGIIPAHVRNIADVSGAGDTVVSVAAICIALTIPLHITAELCNLAGGLVCEKIGVVPITKDELKKEVASNKLQLS